MQRRTSTFLDISLKIRAGMTPNWIDTIFCTALYFATAEKLAEKKLKDEKLELKAMKEYGIPQKKTKIEEIPYPSSPSHVGSSHLFHSSP